MSDFNLSRKEWAIYYKNFAKILQRNGASRKALTDYIIGIGSALDPLPSDGAVTFCQNDMVAFRTDGVKLSLDRCRALKKIPAAREYRGVRPVGGGLGLDKERDVKGACSFEKAT
jgi:hypothetical protein